MDEYTSRALRRMLERICDLFSDENASKNVYGVHKDPILKEIGRVSPETLRSIARGRKEEDYVDTVGGRGL